jgi:hypothetical protein
MTTYPVHYHVEYPARFTRLQLLVRVVAFCALGILGLSFGTVFLFGYLALPALAAIRLGSRNPVAYHAEDGPRISRVLRWFAAVCAWAGLVTDSLPARSPDETVRVEITPSGQPTPSSAMWRLLNGLPSAFVLAFLCWLGMLVWLWAALSILFTRRVGSGAFHYLVGLQRWSVRLLAYQASLVDEYPPFSFSDASSSTLPMARVTP